MLRKSLLVVTFITLLFASGESPKTTKTDTAPLYDKIILVDNFDDGDYKSAPAWWTFGNLDISLAEAKTEQNGFYYLKLTGKAADYYVGGMGTYLGKDASDDDTLVLSVLGIGPNSGKLKLQIYDDDNNTYQLEQDSNFVVLYDDQLEYELPVTWEGWRTVEIPLNKFVDVNQNIGDDVWNPDQKNGSGGLLHVQFVALAAAADGAVNLGLDNIKIVKLK